MMKKFVILTSIIGIALLVIAVAWKHNQDNAASSKFNTKAQQLYGVDANQLNSETVKQLNDANYQNIITSDSLQAKIAKKETFYVYFFSPICPHCKRSTPYINDAFKQAEQHVYQYNVLEDQSAFNTYGFDATPTTIYFKAGKIADKVIGEVSNTDTIVMTPANFEKWIESHK
jgi:thiol-disulfide isomerase/thioredoxin